MGELNGKDSNYDFMTSDPKIMTSDPKNYAYKTNFKITRGNIHFYYSHTRKKKPAKKIHICDAQLF